MHDIPPSELPEWQRLEQITKDIFSSYGYDEIRVPVVEQTELFARAIGDATDVVEKEMYTFEDRNGKLLSLRPEGTAGVVRAVLENGLLYAAPIRLWYQGPMFRRERPQRGRTRQFHQFGVEVFGASGPDIDAELQVLCQRLWKALGLKGLRLEINTLGTSGERASFRHQLHSYLSMRKDQLDEDSVRRLDRNPMRIMDSKNPAIQELLHDAPTLGEHLGTESLRHFDQLKMHLDNLGVPYHVNSRLVRGLDYYSHAVFEWITDELGAQGTVCAGGRYDGLVEIQGGKPWPGVGFAMGQERLVELMRAQSPSKRSTPHVYLVMAGEGAIERGMQLGEQLRRDIDGIRVQINLGGGSFKSQFKRADRSGADLALILGEDELRQGAITVKHLRDHSEQKQLSLDEIAHWLQAWINS
jgi:histidyl-tRNA synthetase